MSGRVIPNTTKTDDNFRFLSKKDEVVLRRIVAEIDAVGGEDGVDLVYQGIWAIHMSVKAEAAIVEPHTAPASSPLTRRTPVITFAVTAGGRVRFRAGRGDLDRAVASGSWAASAWPGAGGSPVISVDADAMARATAGGIDLGPEKQIGDLTHSLGPDHWRLVRQWLLSRGRRWRSIHDDFVPSWASL
jgi:hypothetical protein